MAVTLLLANDKRRYIIIEPQRMGKW